MVWPAPSGYVFKQKEQKDYLIPLEDKDTIIKIFKDFTNDKKQYEIVDALNSIEIEIIQQKVNYILENSIYFGKIKTKSFN